MWSAERTRKVTWRKADVGRQSSQLVVGILMIGIWQRALNVNMRIPYTMPLIIHFVSEFLRLTHQKPIDTQFKWYQIMHSSNGFVWHFPPVSSKLRYTCARTRPCLWNARGAKSIKKTICLCLANHYSCRNARPRLRNRNSIVLFQLS